MKKILLACALLASSVTAYANEKEEKCLALKEFAYSVSEARQNGVELWELKAEIPKAKSVNEQNFYDLAMKVSELVYKYPIARDYETKEITHIISSSQVYLVCLGS